MKYFFTLLVLGLMGMPGYAQNEEGYPVEAEDKSFRIIFPSEPEHENNLTNWEGENFDVHLYKSRQHVGDGQITYAFGYFDYPESYPGKTAQQLLDDLVSSSEGESIIVIKSGFSEINDITLNGYPGKEYYSQFSHSEGQAIYVKTILADERQYFIQVVLEGDAVDRKLLHQFANSLVLN